MQIHIIFGPTASGKTSLALKLATENHGLLVSCDSRKVYKELDIGTHKLELLEFEKQSGQKILGINMFEPSEYVNAFLFRERLVKELKQIKREKYVSLILFGGSGMYIDSLLYGLPHGKKPDSELRDELSALSVDDLRQQLTEIGKAEYEALTESDRANPRRLIRAIEKIKTGQEIAEESEAIEFLQSIIESGHITLHLPQGDRETLYNRINTRLPNYFNEGWISEVSALIKEYGLIAPALQVMGYKEVAQYIVNPGVMTIEELTEKVLQSHRNYAKRQLTWATRYKKPLDLVYPARYFSPKNLEVTHYSWD